MGEGLQLVDQNNDKKIDASDFTVTINYGVDKTFTLPKDNVAYKIIETEDNSTTAENEYGFKVIIPDLKAFDIDAADGKQVVSSDAIITVDYVAELNANAVIGNDGNPNDVYLTYSNNSNTAQGGLNNTGSLRLMDTKVLPAIGAEGSMQWYGDHFILSSDVTADFYEYDSEFNLIMKWHYEEPVMKKSEEQLEYEEDNPPADGTVAFLRVSKFDFTGYYYLAEPVLILPVEPEITEGEETEGAVSENE
jgi:hypothetical protein